MKKYSAAIFDMDGTLIDSGWVWAKVDQEFQKQLNFQVEDGYESTIAHMTTSEMARYTISKYHLDISEQDLQNLWAQLAYEIYANEVLLKPGADQLLKSLKEKGVRLALATSCFRQLSEVTLNRNGVYHYFDTVQFSDEVGKGKEHPDLYLSCATSLEVDPENCIVFEDICPPLSVVKSLGMGFIGVQEGTDQQTEKFLRDNADYYITDYPSFLSSEFYQNSF